MGRKKVVNTALLSVFFQSEIKPLGNPHPISTPGWANAFFFLFSTQAEDKHVADSTSPRSEEEAVTRGCNTGETDKMAGMPPPSASARDEARRSPAGKDRERSARVARRHQPSGARTSPTASGPFQGSGHHGRDNTNSAKAPSHRRQCHRVQHYPNNDKSSSPLPSPTRPYDNNLTKERGVEGVNHGEGGPEEKEGGGRVRTSGATMLWYSLDSRLSVPQRLGGTAELLQHLLWEARDHKGHIFVVSHGREEGKY